MYLYCNLWSKHQTDFCFQKKSEAKIDVCQKLDLRELCKENVNELKKGKKNLAQKTEGVQYYHWDLKRYCPQKFDNFTDTMF